MARENLEPEGYPGIDLSPFRPTGEAVELDAYPACRAIMAVAAAMDPDEPILQVELYTRGVVFVGTDRWSYLTAWVPYPVGDAGWEAGEAMADDWPTDTPLSTIPCRDPYALITKWASLYGKPKRAKEAPKERISIQVGRRLDEDAPTLTEDMAPMAVRFAGPETTTTLTRADEPFIWAPLTQPGWAKPVQAGGWVRAPGRRHAQIGKLGGLDPDGLVATRAKVITGSGGWVIEVSTSGYPRVQGHVMASRPTTNSAD